MRQFDFTPFRRSTVGFDRLFDLLETSARQAGSENYPPFNLERLAEDHYRITLAVAGFKADEIDVTAQQNLLLVSGKIGADDKNERVFLHKGIGTRAFERKFSLADHVKVTDAKLEHGLLTVHLVREVPEAYKPRTIAVNGKAAKKVIEGKKAA